MEILQVAGLYPPHLGGEELVVEALARAQVSDGDRVTVMTSDVGAEPTTPRRANESGVTIRRIRALHVAHTPVMPQLLWHLLRHRPRPDVVHLHTGHAVIAEQVMMACRLRRIPYVVHIHLLVRPTSRLGERLLPIYDRWLFAKFLRRANRVICLTESMRHEVIGRYRLAADRVICVRNGTRIAPRPPMEPDAPRPSVEPDARRPAEVLFVGRLTAQKNILALVEAMALLPDLTLRVLGDGDQRAAVEERIRLLGLSNVVLEGRADQPAVEAAYRAAALLVMPSTHEGMPLVLLDALASGLPVVASPLPELREVGADAVVELADTGPATIARTIRQVLADPTRCRQLSDAGRARAQLFSWDAVAAEVKSVYSDLRTARLAG